MAASPSVTGTIAVAPSSLAAAAGAGAALAAQVSAVAVRGLSADAFANPQCLQAFSSATQLVDEALRTTAASLEQVGHALHAASEAYGLADLLAVPSVTG
jgi:hypothetical protein